MVITKPPELQGQSSNIQVRRSTGTNDKRKAEAAMPGIATAVYREFDQALEHRERHAPTTIRFITSEEQESDPYFSDPFVLRRMLPPLAPVKDRATKLSRIIPDYLSYLETNQVGDYKERRTRATKCSEFVDVVGDLHVDEVKKIHAYKYADWMAERGLANKTIKSAISRVSMLLVQAEKLGLIDANPFNSLSLDDYGKRSMSYLPFDPHEMQKIFAQPIPQNDRLALTLLATTGARLDEIALLEWSQVKVEHGITYLDFRSSVKLRNV